MVFPGDSKQGDGTDVENCEGNVKPDHLLQICSLQHGQDTSEGVYIQ